MIGTGFLFLFAVGVSRQVLPVGVQHSSDLIVQIVSPSDGVTVALGTDVLVAFKLSEAFLSSPIKGACLEVRIVGEVGGTEPLKTCAANFDPFTMTTHAAGSYQFTVTAWASNGDEVMSRTSSPHLVTASRESVLGPEAYSRQEGFRMIYEFSHWSDEGGRSGHGSSLLGAASDTDFLVDFLDRFNVHSLLDAGCGSMTWQPVMLERFFFRTGRRLRFHGSDIVPEVVSRNQGTFREDVFLSFTQLDLANAPAPRGFDAILCRHVLFHNTVEAVKEIIRSANASGAKWFIATTLRPIDEAFPSPLSKIVNVDVKRGTDGRSMSLGGYRPVELEAPPFSLPPPVAWVPERDSEGELVQAEGRQQGIAVWSMPFLQMF